MPAPTSRAFRFSADGRPQRQLRVYDRDRFEAGDPQLEQVIDRLSKEVRRILGSLVTAASKKSNRCIAVDDETIVVYYDSQGGISDDELRHIDGRLISTLTRIDRSGVLFPDVRPGRPFRIAQVRDRHGRVQLNV